MVSSIHPLWFPPWTRLLVIPPSSLLCDVCALPVDSRLLRLHHQPSSLSCCPLLHFSFGDLNELFSAGREVIQCFHNLVYTRLQVKRLRFQTHTHFRLFKSTHKLPGTAASGASDKLQRGGASLGRSFPIFVAALTALQLAGLRVWTQQSISRTLLKSFQSFLASSSPAGFGPETKWMRLSVSLWAGLLNTMWLYCHFDWLWIDHASICKWCRWGESAAKACCIPIYADINNDTGLFSKPACPFLMKYYQEKCKYCKKKERNLIIDQY